MGVRLLFASLSTLLLAHASAQAVIPGPGQSFDAAILKPELWQSALIFQTSQGSCSAHVVGQSVLLTSAHCVRNGGPFLARTSGNFVSLECDAHPSFSATDQKLDFALCVAEKPLPGGAIERINTDPKLIQVGTSIYIVGFGCRLPGGVDRSFGVLSGAFGRLAEPERVVSLHSVEVPNPFPPFAKRVVTSTSVTTSVDSWVLSGVTLCIGDAGGGAFLYPERGPGRRLLVGTNSRSDLSSRSWIAITASPEFVSWATTWSKKNAVSICGIDAKADSCVAGDQGDISKTIGLATKTIGLATETIGLATAITEALTLTRQYKVLPLPGETLRQLVRRSCGDVDDDFYQQAVKLVGSPLDTALTAKVEISIPICPVLGFREQTVKTGDTVWNYYSDIAKAGPTGFQDFKAPSGLAAATESNYYYWNVFQKLNPGINLDALPVGATVRVPLPYSATRSLTATRPKTTEPIFAVPQAAVAGACKVAPPQAGHPFDVAAILDTLLANQRARIERKGYEPQRSNVVIADSGLFGPGSGVFRYPDILVPLPPAKWDGYSNEVVPLTEGSEPMHGTEVASLALGGPLFARIIASRPSPPIGLVITRIYKKTAIPGQPDYYSVVDQVFDKIFANASLNDVRVVNMSMKTDSPIVAMEPYLSASSSLLVVVAAGNFDGQLSSTNSVYPALYGGPGHRGSSNLLAVAGLDNDGTVAPYSNYGSEYVELGAPGCDVPALEYDSADGEWTFGALTGTSMAAPLVSFAAALVRSEVGTGWNGIDIKRRLLVSADLDYGLISKITDGRKLNIRKALSLYSDVVEVDKKLLFGQVVFSLNGTALTDDMQIPLVCSSGNFATHVQDILKLVPKFGSMAKVYVAESRTSLMANRDCQLPANVTLEVKDANGGGSRKFELNQITDYVRAEFK
jgi:Subtilase family/Trypsin